MDDEYVPEHRADGEVPEETKTFRMSNQVYDALKFLAVILLPALGTLYFGLAEIWGLPKASEVVGTVVVVDTFLGVALQITNQQYKTSDARFDGAINVESFEEEGYSNLNLQLDPAAVANKDEVTVKVKRT